MTTGHAPAAESARPAPPSPAEQDLSGSRSTTARSRDDGPGVRDRASLAPTRPAAAPAPAEQTTLWRRLERQLIENGTGILGVVVLVAGVTFLMVNLALRFGPLFRFLLTMTVAAGLIAPSLIWRSPGRWRPLSLWLRSGGAALALFACVAGGALPQVGLRWVEDPGQGLALALAGMGLNLLLAVLTRHQTVASLHVLVTLVPLALVTPNSSTLWIASLVGVCGQVLPRGRPWDRHRLLVSLGSSLFQLSWIVRATDLVADDTALRVQVVVAAAGVFGSGAVLSQMGQALRSRLTAWRLGALISCWAGLALTLLIVPPLALWRASGLIVLAAAALLLARRARRAGAPRLHLSQLLISQSLVMLALVSLWPVVVDGLLINGLLLLESALFLRLSLREPHSGIRRLGWLLVASMAVLLLLQGCFGLILSETPALALQWRHATVLIAGAALVATVSNQLQRRGVLMPLPPLLGWLAGALVFIGPALVDPAWRPLLGLVGMGGLLVLERRSRPAGLGEATCLAVAGAHLGSWLWLLHSTPPAGPLLAQVLPLSALALASRASARRGLRRGLALDLIGVSVGLAVQLLLQPLSPLLPGAAWLLLSLLTLLASNRLGRRDVDHGLAVALGYLGAFTAAFVLVIGPSPTLVALAGVSVRARLLIALLALVVLLGWWLVRPSRALGRSPLWRGLHPCFVEFLVLGSLITVASEVTALMQPLAWSLLALALLSTPVRRLLARRVGLYAVFTYWLAILATLELLSTAQPAAPIGLAAPGTISLLAILLQVLFALLCRRDLHADELINPGGWGLLALIGGRLARHTHRWLLYPLFVAVALHLAHRYDEALLTLLWALEAFGIFVLSLVLRDNQFRLASLLALGVCLIRLVSIDMAQADPVLRGLVFIGVGLLMVAMNAISTRFRDRLGG